jgi:guanylate kinase
MINFITISAPSGAGKTTLCKALRSVQPDIEWSVSHTTRSKRDIEIDGVDYHFITMEKFEELILKEAFAEWENVHGYYYGTTKNNLESALTNDKTLLLEMDVKGSMSVKKLYPQHTFSIFILPPSLEHLRKRLKNRGTDSDDRIEIRLKRFQQEIEFQNKFDQVMINENLELAKVELINIVNKLKQGVINGT